MKNKLAHLILVLGLAIAVVAFFRASGPDGRFLVVLAATVFYLTWGFLYHHLRRDISAKLLLEYLAIAAIASVVNVIVFGR